ncbi:ABC transporter permease [Achromobacter sp. GG226]|uniref:ABC transporter permease n=1 Tax=Verticiella alkaliphila TaxID=2779529 RepID=UPI001C0B0318|nr:ABC transporter permease [Verticiella sp. GG226]MBU4609196.1 ABC transporter permease [Verticiella sp. GG226]
MQAFSASPRELVASLWRNRALIGASAKREVLGRYRGSALGLLWSFFNPLLMLSVYTFVFSEVFNARWGAASQSKTEFALILFAGLLIFNVFSECANRAPSLILSNPNYVKKVVFPLEVLPVIALMSALYHFVVTVAVWLAAYVVMFGVPHATIFYLPLIIGPFCLFILGVCWALASLGVFLRDVAQIIGVLTMALMFLSPIFYPATAVPEAYRHILSLNPLTQVIENSRAVMFWGRAPDWSYVGFAWITAAVIAWVGFAWFQKTRKGFADVL